MFVFNNVLRFTFTGGYWSSFFYEEFILPYLSRHNNIYKLACMVEGDPKDVEQFKFYCNLNHIPWIVYKDRVPPGVFRLDYRPFFNPDIDTVKDFDCYAMLKHVDPKIVKQLFYDFLERRIKVNNIDAPSDFLNRDIKSCIEKFCAEDFREDEFNLKSFVPGPGFEFLTTNNYNQLPFSILGEYHNVDYIKGAHDGTWFNKGLNPAIHVNPTFKDMKIHATDFVPYIGRIPKKVVKCIYPKDIADRTFDAEAKVFFDSTQCADDYHVAPVCLKNVVTSVLKYCPDSRRSVSPAILKPSLVLAAYNYTKQDWTFGTRSQKIMPDEDVILKRNWTSSPGYPYNKTESNARAAHSSFLYHVKNFEANAGTVWMPTIYNVFGKQEVLKAAKGDDIRTIIAPCLAHQLVSQKLTMSMSEKVSSNYLTSHTSIGRTRYRGDVDNTANRISRFPVICEYDISKWDRSIKAFPLKLFWLYCWDILDSEDLQDFNKLANIFESTIYSHMVVPSGDMVRKAYGVPSGFTLTSYANSWIHTLLVVMSFLDLYPDQKASIEDRMAVFKAELDFVCYGDDGLMGFTNEIGAWYTLEARSRWYQEMFGISLPPEKSKIQYNLAYSIDGFEVSGITFLGDVLARIDGVVQPIFSVKKSIGSIVHSGFDKKYTPHERVAIAFTHYVNCFFHPESKILLSWLKMLIKNYKHYTPNIKNKGFEYDMMALSANEFIAKITALLNTDKLDEFILDFFYTKKEVFCSLQGYKNTGSYCYANSAMYTFLNIGFLSTKRNSELYQSLRDSFRFGMYIDFARIYTDLGIFTSKGGDSFYFLTSEVLPYFGVEKHFNVDIEVDDACVTCRNAGLSADGEDISSCTLPFVVAQDIGDRYFHDFNQLFCIMRPCCKCSNDHLAVATITKLPNVVIVAFADPDENATCHFKAKIDYRDDTYVLKSVSILQEGYDDFCHATALLSQDSGWIEVNDAVVTNAEPPFDFAGGFYTFKGAHFAIYSLNSHTSIGE